MPDQDAPSSERALPWRAQASNFAGTIRDHRHVVIPLLGGNLLLGVLGFATSAAASRLLGTAGRGELAARQNIPNLLAVLGSLGLGEAALYFSARHPRSVKTITVQSLRLGTLGVFGAATIAAALIAISLSSEDTRTGAFWYLLVIPVTVVYTIAYQPLRALGRHALWMGYRLGISAGWFGCLLIGFALDRPSPQLVAMMFCGVMSIAALSACIVARNYPNAEPESAPSNRELLRYSLPAAILVVPQAINLRLDQVLLASLVSREQLGLYVAAVGWSWVALPVFTAFGQFVFPKVAALEGAEQDRWRRRAIVWSSSLAVITFAALVVPTRLLFAVVMGEDFRSGVNLATLMLGAGVLNGMLLVLEELCKGLGFPKRVLLAEVVGLLSTVVLLILLLQRFGITGAAVASIGGYSTTVVVLLIVLLNKDNQSVRSATA